jgi:hypothetical protein
MTKVVRQVLAECEHGSGMAAIALEGTMIQELILRFPCGCQMLVDTVRVEGSHSGPRIIRVVPPQPQKRPKRPSVFDPKPKRQFGVQA